MKTILTIAIFSVNVIVSAQNNSDPWPVAGNVGIGTAVPAANLQIHGTTDYQYEFEGDKYGELGGYYNAGRTSTLLLTNSQVGSLITDGSLLRMSQKNFHLENLEAGNVVFRSSNTSLLISGEYERMFLGQAPTGDNQFAKFNINSKDNGLYIEATSGGSYGLAIKTAKPTDFAMQVFDYNDDRNFLVYSSGEVFARKYTTTLNAIPDYVFSPNYDLMSLPELRKFVQEKHHLPNIPSATEYAQNGVDLGELNRLLLEKTEELTLYILQLEERLKALEEK